MNKSLRGALNNNLTFKFDNRSIQSNIKTNNTLLNLLNENFPCRTFVRQRQHMRVRRPLKTTNDFYVCVSPEI